ncbi:DUF2577 domain-containing protein [Paenibacillus sp. Cedars]|uniref:DUF2577 domain-containing protein n=1 Tax=Paenibacillus sp. Cedars TaxID=1980674 RepID=UPI0011622D96|nr:DUF2577 domain-containing protein [Paenibacillus sp. Cedars]AWP28705.1 hypothetical protein B9D94_19655 [Paenibacillus sp. Cedars]
MLDIIKRAAVEAVVASNPVAIQFGTVVSLSPLEVRLDQRLTLPEAFLIVPESLTRYEIDLSHVHKLSGSPDTEKALTDKIVIRKGLAVGDAVILLRVQGGQKYLVLDKAVSG